MTYYYTEKSGTIQHLRTEVSPLLQNKWGCTENEKNIENGEKTRYLNIYIIHYRTTQLRQRCDIGATKQTLSKWPY